LPGLPERHGDDELHAGRRRLRWVRTAVVVVGVALLAAAVVIAGVVTDVLLG
jgi:hypothetical protein